jgi:hypothetical protein
MEDESLWSKTGIHNISSSNSTNPIICILTENLILETVPFDNETLPRYHKILKKQRNSDPNNCTLVNSILPIFLQNLNHDPVWCPIVLLDVIKNCLKWNNFTEQSAVIAFVNEKAYIWAPWLFHEHLTVRRKAIEIASLILTLNHSAEVHLHILWNLKHYLDKLNDDRVGLSLWFKNRGHVTEFVYSGFRDLGSIKKSILLLIHIFLDSPSISSQHLNIYYYLSMFGKDIDIKMIQIFSDHDEDLITILLHIFRLTTILNYEIDLNLFEPCRMFCRFLSYIEFDEYTLADIILESPQCVTYMIHIIPLLNNIDLSKFNSLEAETDFARSVELTLTDLKSVLEKVGDQDLRDLIKLL